MIKSYTSDMHIFIHKCYDCNEVFEYDPSDVKQGTLSCPNCGTEQAVEWRLKSEYTVMNRHLDEHNKDKDFYECLHCGSINEFTYNLAYSGELPNFCPNCGKKILNQGD